MNAQQITETLGAQFNGNVRLVEKRPGVLQIYAPLYHEDGDMLDIFVTKTDGHMRLSDFGLTVMRLSYTFDLDTDNKIRIFNELLTQNQVEFDETAGAIYLDTTPDNLCVSLLHFAQVVGKVARLDVLKREVISGLFFEMVDEFITRELLQFQPRPRVLPLAGREELEVPWAFDIRPAPVYLFPVRNSSQIRMATISLLQFQRERLQFKGHVVHDDFDNITPKDRKLITSAADKQFISLENFKEHAKDVLLREQAA